MVGSERRRPEAGGLRALFQVQIDHLSALLDQRTARRDEERRRNDRELQAVEALVEGTDSRMRAVNGYRRRLRASVAVLLDYVAGLAERLPAPVAISGERFLPDPLVNAFFVNRQAIRDIFSRSHDLQDFFADPGRQDRSHAWALLFMTMREKETLGLALTGELLSREVRQTNVSFTDHRVIQARASEDEVRSALAQFLFDAYVEYINYRLACLRVGPVGVCAQCAGIERPAGTDAPDLKNPAVYLELLCQVIEQPAELLQLETDLIRINRIGIRVPEQSDEVAEDRKSTRLNSSHNPASRMPSSA
jgi:hypothetical protein